MRNRKVKENGWLLIAIVIGSFFNSFMSSSLNIAMPVINAEYRVGVAQVAWISKSFLLASAIGLLLAGWIADRYGRRNTFLAGNAVFGFISLLIAIIPGFYPAVVLRFIQGLGSAMIMASAPALIASAFATSRRGFVLGIQTTFTYIGLSLAPLLGGLLTQMLGWKSLFVFNFIFTTFALGIMFFGVKKEWRSETKKPFDLQGYFLFVIAILGIVLALDWMNRNSLIGIGISALAGYAFVVYERRKAHPFISVTFLKENRYFTNSILAALINYATTFAISYVLSLYLQNIRGMTPVAAGFVLCFQPVMMALFSAYAGHLSDKHNPGKIASYGMGIISAALFAIGLLVNKTLPLYVLAILLAILGVGFALFSSPNTNAVMSSVNAGSYGFASAFLAFGRLFGQFLSMALASGLILLINNSQATLFGQEGLLLATKISFLIFGLLSCFGVYLSYQRVSARPKNKA
ncbi:MAG TPA: MFS transporter [Dysgonamonadaceae bacterium]|nr:MFS transporter [Dysgonamonadaceae bacterium]